MCKRHYFQAYNAKRFTPATPPSPLERFWSHVAPGDGGCLEWVRPRNNMGYGRFLLDGKKVMATRWIYEQLVGPIPDGLHLCHTCDNPPCVNVEHLWPGTRSQNLQDMAAKGRFRNQNTGKTHCKHGHEFTPENTYRYGGNRMCKTCIREREQRYKAEGRVRMTRGRP